MTFSTIFSFLFFTALVGGLTWYLTRKNEFASRDGFFLAGRSLTFPFIAGSLLLTNLSTEQLVGLNGSAFTDGLSVMAWEVCAVVALVLMALFFLPRFLKAGVTTVPEFLAQRFDHGTELICNIIFLSAYAVILLPIILYTGARGMMDVLQLQDLFGFSSETQALWCVVILVAVIGSIYAIWGGLASCAVSDTLNGIGLLAGGLLITGFAFYMLGGVPDPSGTIIEGTGSFSEGVNTFVETARSSGRLNSIGSNGSSVPFFTLFTGIFFINVFYWCTNQQIIQRTFGAKSLGEGQKGVLLTGALKLLGPLYLVIPGIIAAIMLMKGFQLGNIAPDGTIASDKAYGSLVNFVLPEWLTGFFAAVLLGAILSSFNSALNSTCTLFSLGIYKQLVRKNADDRHVVRAGRWFGVIITVISIAVAPLLAETGGIFNYLQKMNAIYFIPILTVVAVGMLTKRVPAKAAKFALIAGIVLIAAGYFLPPFNRIQNVMSEYHFVAIVLLILVAAMLIIGKVSPQETDYLPQDAKTTDLTPWAGAKYAGIALLAAVFVIYAFFADFSSIHRNNVEIPRAPAPPADILTD
ncbi:MAG: solute:sodium symporter family transporter [Lentisphaerae bacterium]|nr:solute:sodium symporter family transporter [Lentisphaerota bacterium]